MKQASLGVSARAEGLSFVQFCQRSHTQCYAEAFMEDFLLSQNGTIFHRKSVEIVSRTGEWFVSLADRLRAQYHLKETALVA